MKTLMYLVLIASTACLLATPIRAQQAGDFRFTYGYESELRPRHEEEGFNTQRLKASLKINLHPRIYTRIGNTNLLSRQLDDGTRLNGVGSTSLALGADVITEDMTGISKRPALSFEYVIFLPTASKALGAFRPTNHSVAASVAKSFGEEEIVEGEISRRSEVGVDLGTFFAEKSAGGYSKTPEMTLSFTHALDSLGVKKYTYRGELYMSAPTKDSLSEISALNQLTIQLQPKARFTAGVRTGLTPNSPRLVFFGSISFGGSFR